MNHSSKNLTASLLLFALAGCSALAAEPQTPSRTEVLPILEKCADGQIAAMGDKTPIDWTAAAFYVGLARLTHISDNPKYVKALERIADTNHWQVKAGKGPRRFHADDQAVGQMYIDLASHLKDGDARLVPLIQEQTALLDHLKNFKADVADPSTATRPDNQKMQPIAWWWCDALFMNPPVLARLSTLTGDKKFIDGMDHAWDETHSLLFDTEEHLYYRDNRFPGQKTKNGKKVFWSRGDGWVMGGLAEVLTWAPKDWDKRAKYEARFKEMADKLISVQKADGLWAPSLLDAEDPNFEETSGTAFFTYAFAWGVNNKLLDAEKFQPAALKGWHALTAKLRPDGQLGFVQPVGFKPDGNTPITIDSTQYYGNGAFILAGSEIMKFNK